MNTLNLANILQLGSQIPGNTKGSGGFGLSAQSVSLAAPGQALERGTENIADVFQLLLAQFAAQHTNAPLSPAITPATTQPIGLQQHLLQTTTPGTNTPVLESPGGALPLADLQALLAQLTRSGHTGEHPETPPTVQNGQTDPLGQLLALLDQLEVLTDNAQLSSNLQPGLLEANISPAQDAFTKLGELLNSIAPGAAPTNVPEAQILQGLQQLQDLLQNISLEDTGVSETLKITVLDKVNTLIQAFNQSGNALDSESSKLNIQPSDSKTQKAQQALVENDLQAKAQDEPPAPDASRKANEYRSNITEFSAQKKLPSQETGVTAQAQQASQHAKPQQNATTRIHAQGLSVVEPQSNEFSPNNGQSFLSQNGFDNGFASNGATVRVTGDLANIQQNFAQHLAQARMPTHPASQHLSLQLTRGAENKIENMLIKLQPAELGRVQVEMTFGDDGAVRAHMIVDKPDTLQLLQRDSNILQKALHDAGLDVSQDSLSFDLRQQDQNTWQDANNKNTADDEFANALNGNTAELENAVLAHMSMASPHIITRDHVNVMV